MNGKEIVMHNLSKYEFVKKYLGKAIRKRIEIRGYTRGMLSAHLLDEKSKSDLQILDQTLQLGEAFCQSFDSIFQERKLSNKDLNVDGEIINVLAEVKAFEVLYKHNFKDITKIKRRKSEKTVDFTANKDEDNYAIEVTRLGLAKAERKKPVYMVKDKIPTQNIPCVPNLKGEFFIMSGKDNVPRIGEILSDTIQNKYRQIKEFCQTRERLTKGILFISSGRDYFVMNKYARTEFEMHPNAVKETLIEIWHLLKEDPSALKHLQNVVISIGKNVENTIIFPEFKGAAN